ncbi:MAG: zf-HC2 domain-containing protein [Gemmatimonadaceae bacterium]|nr:zf-HC2 domain-containing protein [Gemmatimonadaceae bacterium]
MQHPDEGMIHAWIDGALMAEEAASLESHAAQCDQCAAAIAEARGLVAASSRILLALDDVPAGVIPLPVPKARAWYARNDLRAAAAVLFVASASLVVARGRQDVSPRTNDVASLSVDTAAPTSASSIATTSTAAAEARTMAAAPARDMQPESQMARQRAGTEVIRDAARPTAAANSTPLAKASAAPPSGIAPIAAAPMARDRMTVTNEADFSGKGVRGGSAAGMDSGQTRRIGSSQFALEQVVVTGVASEVPRSARADARANARANAATLKIVRADTAQRVRTIVYEVSKGIEVTLTQTEPTSFDQPTVLQRRSAGAAVQAPSAPLPAPPALATLPPVAGSAVTVMKAPINSISWADTATGRTYTLTGALARGELEALKMRIAAQREHGLPLSRE